MPSSVSSSSTQSQPRSHVSKLSQSHHPDISRPATPLTNGTGKPNGHRDASTPSSTTRKPSDQRQLVADRLSILNSILQPLPPTLPPSPPLSPKRLKRKSLEDEDVPSLGLGESGVKRARVSAETSPPSHSRHSSSSTPAQISDPRPVSPNNANAASSQSAVKKEEGELEESPSVSRVASFSSRANGVNVHRQPRPRRTIDPSAFGKLSELYQTNAKQLKRSATKRRSPTGNTPQGIEFIASLEDTDSILHFAYSFWAMGQQHGRGSSSQLLKIWESIQDYISFVNRAWEKLLSVAPDADRKGRIKMVMALLNLIRYSAWYQVYKLHSNRLRQANETINANANSPGNRNSASPPGFQPTPPYTTAPMPPPAQNTAPSPASSSPPGGQSNSHRGQHAGSVGQSPQHHSPSGPTVSVPVDVLTMQSRMLHAQDQMMRAQTHYSAELTLFNIHRLFPKAYEVCVGNAPNNYTPLTPGRREDYHSVDPEACGKGEGDWAWPPVSGDDVVHAVGFGRSILREFGEHYGGYKGLEGTTK
ncbi:hypothetical protein M407DRAFT_114793 [Tulasnella calospora MUT 4182]|uniref:Uncharacterized protein n=1 Tax=Tulasnella calospora MUT 4182 TaxID=1051891 RepID=A0A0C3QC45_9AGAM|nr:hypothetical protein M407DRAFT_114793 [Tulasnella calospora MUT 4182]